MGFKPFLSHVSPRGQCYPFSSCGERAGHSQALDLVGCPEWLRHPTHGPCLSLWEGTLSASEKRNRAEDLGTNGMTGSQGTWDKDSKLGRKVEKLAPWAAGPMEGDMEGRPSPCAL